MMQPRGLITRKSHEHIQINKPNLQSRRSFEEYQYRNQIQPARLARISSLSDDEENYDHEVDHMREGKEMGSRTGSRTRQPGHMNGSKSSDDFVTYLGHKSCGSGSSAHYHYLIRKTSKDKKVSEDVFKTDCDKRMSQSEKPKKHMPIKPGLTKQAHSFSVKDRADIARSTDPILSPDSNMNRASHSISYRTGSFCLPNRSHSQIYMENFNSYYGLGQRTSASFGSHRNSISSPRTTKIFKRTLSKGAIPLITGYGDLLKEKRVEVNVGRKSLSKVDTELNKLIPGLKI